METVFDIAKRVLFITYELGYFILSVIGGMLFGSGNHDDESIVESNEIIGDVLSTVTVERMDGSIAYVSPHHVGSGDRVISG